MDDLLAFALFLVLMFSVFIAGLSIGDKVGMESIHKGIYECLTLPDETIECWAVPND